MIASESNIVRDGVYFRGFSDKPRKYPVWRYHNILDPKIVNNTEEDEAAAKEGYDPLFVPLTCNKVLSNWFWDLEDMSPKQLCVFAKEEFGVDLPIEAKQEKLFQAVCRLTREAPQNKNRIILMAHTIKMNYRESLEDIKNLMKYGEKTTETRILYL